MSEENENNQENKTEVTIKSNISDKPIKIEGTTEDIEKFKQIMKAQKEYDHSIVAENAQLKAERAKEFEKQFGESGNSAPLNDNQLTGGLSEGEKQLLKECLPSDNEGLPVDLQSFTSEYDMINQLEKQAQNGNVEAKKALANLLSKATEKSFDLEYDGDPRDLYKIPRTAKEKAELAKKRQLWVRR